MIRKIVKIDEEKCNGCRLCVDACHEGALQIINGKAKLISESYCDGLGDCLPACPQNAIILEEREAANYDEVAVMNNIKNNSSCSSGFQCPSTVAKSIERKESAPSKTIKDISNISQLKQWPVQIKLVPINAPYFKNTDLLIAADCTAFAYANIHEQFMKNKITLIGCPKLDSVDYSEKLTEILKRNDIKSISILKMIVPCCGGIVNAVKTALVQSNKMIPWSITTVNTDGTLVE